MQAGGLPEACDRRGGKGGQAVGWMRMMGQASVEYHRETVNDHIDDFPGQALAYYASRGETPLAWGGSGTDALGLCGAVTAEEYEAIYGQGGARHPGSGEPLVSTRRPGMEIVISAHKSVAELGVIGRAAHMHLIMDAERDATRWQLHDDPQGADPLQLLIRRPAHFHIGPEWIHDDTGLQRVGTVGDSDRP